MRILQLCHRTQASELAKNSTLEIKLKNAEYYFKKQEIYGTVMIKEQMITVLGKGKN